MAIQGGDILWRITADGAQLAKTLKGGTLGIAAFTQTLVNVGRIASAVFGGLERIFVEPIRDSITAAMDFGTAMARVNSLAVKDLGAISDAVKDVSAKFGLDLVNGADAAYQAISSGATEAEVPRLLADAAIAATAGVSDLTTAIELGTSVSNAFGKEIKDVSQIYDEAFVAAKLGVTTFEELSATVGNLSPAFVAAGLTSGEMFASISALTLGGIKTTEAVTGLKAVVTAFQRQGDTAALSTMGFEGALKLLRDETAGNDQALLDYLGSTEAMAAVLALTGSQASSFSSILGEMKNSTGAAQEAFDLLAASDPALAWRQLKSEVQVIKIELGEALLPILKSVMDAIKPVAAGIREWISANKEFITSAIETSGVAEMMSDAFGWVQENWETLKQAMVTGAEIVWNAIKTIGGIVEVVFIGASAIIVGFVSGVGSAFSDLISDTDMTGKTWQEKLNLFLSAARDIFVELNTWLQDIAIPWLRENWDEIVAEAQSFYTTVAIPIAEFSKLVIGAVEDVWPYLSDLAWLLGEAVQRGSQFMQIAGIGKGISALQDLWNGETEAPRSKGGHVVKGKSYRVGERGAEVMFPADGDNPYVVGAGGTQRWKPSESGWILNHGGVGELLSAMPRGPLGQRQENERFWSAGILNALISNKVPGSFYPFVWDNNVWMKGLLKIADARAMGGPVKAGNPYLVGERGRELFVPNTDGGIVPNNQLGGALGSVSISINANTINMRNADDADALSRELAGRVQLRLNAMGWA
jgi:TP901 family phage tail tape measure protein